MTFCKGGFGRGGLRLYRLLVSVALIVLISGLGRSANAGGYDTPMLYSARHMGMGGTAVSYVKDPSALFHNPAGLGHIKKLSLLADFSLLVGGIRSAVDTADVNIDSEPVVAPFFLLGAGYRVTDFLTLGFAVYPVASASAKYKYQSSLDQPVENSTTLIFIESTLGAAVNIDKARLRIGAGYRVTYVSLARKQEIGGTPTLDFDMKGWNFLGFRVGAQWDAIPKHLSIGINYRHKTVTEVTQDQLIIPAIFGGTADNGSAEFTLPARLAFGVRGDYANFGAAIDFEWAFNSQNKETVIKGTPPSGTPIALANVFEWDDAMTLRLGTEYRIALGKERAILPRLGFVFDARTGNKSYPTAFGTPPGPTYVLTGGVGYEHGPYNVNLAYGYRFGTADVSDADIQKGRTCAFCSKPGDYKIFLNGIYLDFSYDFK